MLLGQGAHGGDNFKTGKNLESFFARAAFGGITRQTIEHGGAGLAGQRQFRRRRRFVFAHARHAAIDGIAVEHSAAFAGDDPGDVGLARSLGDTQRILGGAAAPRPYRKDKKQRHHGDAEQKRVTGKARNLGRGNAQSGGRKRQQNKA